jgi:Zn-dependent peptidase ImmA (M78 family)
MSARVNYPLIRKRAAELIAHQAAQQRDHAPIDLIAIADTLRAEVREMDLADDISGVLYRDGERRIIVVNRAHSDVRKRFTIAHELGHLALHRGDKVHVDHDFRINLRDPSSATAENVEEIEANAFAANLLMPAQWIWSALDEAPIDLADDGQMAEVATRFGVSQHALLIRIAALNPFERGRPSARKSVARKD